MKRLLLLSFSVILLGAGCSNQQASLLQDQQKQIDKLNKKIEEITPQITTTTETKSKAENKTQQKKIDKTKSDDYAVTYAPNGDPVNWADLEKISMIFNDTLTTYETSLPEIIKTRDSVRNSVNKAYAVLANITDPTSQLRLQTLIDLQEAHLVASERLITFLDGSIKNYQNLLETIKKRDSAMYLYYSNELVKTEPKKAEIINDYTNKENAVQNYAKSQLTQ